MSGISQDLETGINVDKHWQLVGEPAKNEACFEVVENPEKRTPNVHISPEANTKHQKQTATIINALPKKSWLERQV